MTRTYSFPVSEALPERAAIYLSGEEARVYGSLRFPKRRRDFLAGRIAAKRLLQKVAGSFLDWEVLNGPDGRPFVRLRGERFPCSISISHGPEAAGCALGWSRRVGLDIERIEPRDPAWLDIAFHSSERTPELERSPELQTALWTLKEAVSKLLGTGLSVDLWDIRFPGFPKGRRTPLLHGAAHRAWEGLGAPRIRCRSRRTGRHFVSLAQT